MPSSPPPRRARRGGAAATTPVDPEVAPDPPSAPEVADPGVVRMGRMVDGRFVAITGDEDRRAPSAPPIPPEPGEVVSSGPPYGNPWRTASFTDDDGTRVVRCFPDHGARWCLWEDGSDDYTPTATDLGASQRLEDEIGEWYDYWESRVQPGIGSDGRADTRFWITWGLRLVAELNEELNDDGIVVHQEFAWGRPFRGER